MRMAPTTPVLTPLRSLTRDLCPSIGTFVRAEALYVHRGTRLQAELPRSRRTRTPPVTARATRSRDPAPTFTPSGERTTQLGAEPRMRSAEHAAAACSRTE